jgi:hypothetical protein
MFLIVSYNWNNTTNAGVWNVNFNNNRTNTNVNMSARSDYGSRPHTSRMGIVEPQGCVIQRYAKSDKRPLFGRETEDQRREEQK